MKSKLIMFATAVAIASAALAGDVRLGWDASKTPGVQYILQGSTNKFRTAQSTNLGTNLAVIATIQPGPWAFRVRSLSTNGVLSLPSDWIRYEMKSSATNVMADEKTVDADPKNAGVPRVTF